MRVLAIALVSLEFMTVVFGDDGDATEYVIYKQAVEFLDECGSRDLSLCLKERSLKYLDSLPNTIDIGGGLKIKENNASRTSRQQASVVLPDESNAREDALDNALLKRLTDYMRSHNFEYKMPSETVNELENSVEEGRKKKGDGGGLRMRSMLVLFVIKAVALAAVGLKFLGLVAFKALLVGKIALTIAGIISLKKLVEDKHRSSASYEVYARPLYEDHSHFDRSFKTDLSYKGREAPRSTD